MKNKLYYTKLSVAERMDKAQHFLELKLISTPEEYFDILVKIYQYSSIETNESLEILQYED